jgi:7,8-dihydroneopterin aldolase/epimerase/oxygenase
MRFPNPDSVLPISFFLLSSSLEFFIMDILHLKSLQFFGRHGTEEWEKLTGRRFMVDLDLMGDFTKAAENDQLEEALDYRVVYARARHVVETESHNLIERIAWRLMAEMFRTFPVQAVRVRVAKPEAPIGGLNQAVEIEICRTRAQFEESQTARQFPKAHERDA